MNKRVLLYLAFTTSLLAAALYIISIAAPSQQPNSTKRLGYNHVRGSSLEYKGLPYTLNFDQQNEVITYLNAAQEALLPEQKLSPLPYSKLIIYRFNAPDIIVTPLGYISDNLVFKADEWHGGHTLLDKSEGKLKKILEETYGE